jgi:hypothetical protein
MHSKFNLKNVIFIIFKKWLWFCNFNNFLHAVLSINILDDINLGKQRISINDN